jgi:hypothetical protein
VFVQPSEVSGAVRSVGVDEKYLSIRFPHSLFPRPILQLYRNGVQYPLGSRPFSESIGCRFTLFYLLARPSKPKFSFNRI